MSVIYKTRVMQKLDTETNWTSKNPVLLKGEIVISKQSDGSYRLKVGDGTNKYSSLEYIDEYAISKIPTRTKKTVTLSTSKWSNKTLKVTDSSIKTTSNVIVTPSLSSIDNYMKFGIRCSAIATGSITFSCYTTPNANISVELLIIN